MVKKQLELSLDTTKITTRPSRNSSCINIDDPQKRFDYFPFRI